MNPSSAIEKGKLLENYVCEQIREKGIDPKAYRSHGSGNGNTEKADIWTSMTVLGQNAGIECKNHKTLHIPEWWKQTKKLESLGREPILVFKQFGESLGDTKVVIYLDTFLELVKASNGVKVIHTTSTSTPNNREIQYQLSQLINSAKKIIKHYDEEETLS